MYSIDTCSSCGFIEDQSGCLSHARPVTGRFVPAQQALISWCRHLFYRLQPWSKQRHFHAVPAGVQSKNVSLHCAFLFKCSRDKRVDFWMQGREAQLILSGLCYALASRFSQVRWDTLKVSSSPSSPIYSRQYWELILDLVLIGLAFKSI